MVHNNIDSSDASSTSSIDELLREDSEGWEDAEPEEEEQIQVKDFFSDKTFPDAASMIKYAAEQHDFDFLKITRDFGEKFPDAILLRPSF
jgi:protein arginine N-methyltransferase 3